MDWIAIGQLIQNLGVSVVCLLALAWAVWKGITWIGARILQPLADRHIKFIDEVAQSVQNQTKVMTELSTSRHEELKRFDHITQMLENVVTNLTEVRTEVKQIVIRTDSVQINPKQKADKEKPIRDRNKQINQDKDDEN